MTSIMKLCQHFDYRNKERSTFSTCSTCYLTSLKLSLHCSTARGQRAMFLGYACVGTGHSLYLSSDWLTECKLPWPSFLPLAAGSQGGIREKVASMRNDLHPHGRHFVANTHFATLRNNWNFNEKHMNDQCNGKYIFQKPCKSIYLIFWTM